MERLQAEAISLRPVEDGGGLRSVLTIGGKSTEIDGSILEAVVRLTGIGTVSGYFLFLTDDIPYEDTLSLVLLGEDLRVLDSARLGGMYSTGKFADLVLDPPARMTFRFFNEAVWTVTVFDKPSIRLPFAGEPAGVHRRFGFQRRFAVKQTRLTG